MPEPPFLKASQCIGMLIVHTKYAVQFPGNKMKISFVFVSPLLEGESWSCTVNISRLHIKSYKKLHILQCAFKGYYLLLMGGWVANSIPGILNRALQAVIGWLQQS